MKILAFAASSNKNSINKKLVTYAANLAENAEIDIIDINDYEMPIFSEDREKELGQPQQAKDFYQKIGEADAIIISYAEHNGTYTAAYKNLFDWTSRINQKVYQNKAMVILATTPGPGGASSVLNTAVTSGPYFAANIIGSLSVPSFYDNFDSETGKLSNQALNDELKAIINKL
ncbi:NAD(P)H-dependent oxidoreductase [Pseudocolwellia sp. AS88]|uniref:NADPH-dependent FMN reductase n=1 Tax=Pseudocolwellia sp. AS88 TaxID=3063958 RepID=UPI0026EEE534|nr:NAD(P)H-dependent oxidoreductase [Pseudocolwellia sp. AS88]MDO7083339.1 NAD(P)H-dependent oxidoreductase [Pseudocolwellia sp. AS88]